AAASGVYFSLSTTPLLTVIVGGPKRIVVSQVPGDPNVKPISFSSTIELVPNRVAQVNATFNNPPPTNVPSDEPVIDSVTFKYDPTLGPLVDLKGIRFLYPPGPNVPNSGSHVSDV